MVVRILSITYNKLYKYRNFPSDFGVKNISFVVHVGGKL